MRYKFWDISVAVPKFIAHFTKILIRTRDFRKTGARGPFLESSGNFPGPISVFGDKCIIAEVNFC